MAQEFAREYNNQKGYSNDLKETENPSFKNNPSAGEIIIEGGAQAVKFALTQGVQTGEAEFVISAVQKADYTWIIVLSACLSAVALAAGYVAIYFITAHVMAKRANKEGTEQ